ncbi:bifunctional 2-polyprenyl-6-hydroxyphenol methylase/3-demethylubiquinol 3-O-methyltransferase UbiG [Aliiglaciecola litoralis]|uniref:Ubiquinone biosynthesis O-methyltransferase n=1 Tax=Aliiglaciecola litoralis TaxID=582857 RepID=A0ABN1LSG3_9ALTE
MLDKSEVDAPLTNLSKDEIAKFDRLADQWWDPQGKYQTALSFNAARLSFIKAQIQQHFASNSNTVSVLDVGSGGGLISEPLAKAGYQVTGIDPSSVSVQVAKQHALRSSIEVNYIHGLASDLDPQKKQFDVVINAEVVEHVPDQQLLINQCAKLVKPGGLLILATLNRTVKSWLIAIVGAEYVMGYLPKGTHSWDKFVKPDELIAWTSEHGFCVRQSTGLSLNPLSKKWSLNQNLAVNYVLSLSRE